MMTHDAAAAGARCSPRRRPPHLSALPPTDLCACSHSAAGPWCCRLRAQHPLLPLHPISGAPSSVPVAAALLARRS
eukprot:3922243-Prymnesium_polylepis.1